jgi:amino acid permease
MAEDVNVEFLINEIGGKRRGSGFLDENIIQSTVNNTNSSDMSKTKSISIEKENKDGELTICSFNLNAWFCIINLIAGAFGTGVFTFPAILYNIGLFNASICFIFVSVSVYYSLDLLRRFVVDNRLYSYSIITQATLGYSWLVMYSVSSFIVYMMSISNYLKSLFNITCSVIPGINESTIAKFCYYFITYIIEVILCIFTSNLSKIHILSLIAFWIFLIILIRIIIESIYNMSVETERFDYVTAFTIKNGCDSWEKFLSIMTALNDFLFGFISHSTFPTLLNSFSDPNNDLKTRKINRVQLIILYIIYGLFTFFGLFCLDQNNPQEVILNKKDLDNVGEYFFNVLVMIYLITLVPIRYIIIRDNYTSILKKDYLSGKYEILTTALFLLINNIITCFVGDSVVKTTFIQIFSGIFGVFMCFILPVINHVKINGKTKMRSIIGYIISGIFLLIGIFSIIFSLKNTNWS